MMMNVIITWIPFNHLAHYGVRSGEEDFFFHYYLPLVKSEVFYVNKL